MKKEYGFLGFCALIFVSCSIGLYYAAANTTTAHLDLDSPSYDRIGMYFSCHNQLVDPNLHADIPVQTVGYPLFLGIVYKLSGHNYSYVIFLQVLLSLVVGWLLFLIAQDLFNKKVGLIAVFLYSLNLGFLIYSQFILTEILLATLLIAALERFFSFKKTFRMIELAQAGLLFGISIIVKPVALFYIGILIFFLIVSSYFSLKRMVQYIILFTGCFSLPIIGYMAHNKLVYGAYTIAPVMYENIYYYFLAKIIAHEQNISNDQALNQINELLNHKWHNDATRWKKPRELMYAYVKKRPFLLLYMWLKNMSKTFFGSYSTQLKLLVNPNIKGTKTSFFEKKGAMLERVKMYLTDGIEGQLLHFLIYCHAFLLAMQYLFLAIGFFVLLRSKEYILLTFLALSILYFAFITGHDGCARYRMMFECLIILVASLGLASLCDLIIFKKKKKLKFS
jgi:4-amino-4-deoxy-L-arabinose transferase-like glycosyltransferase